MEEEKQSCEILSDDKDAASSVIADRNEKVLKVVKMFKGEVPSIKKEVVFPAGTVKVQCPFDNFKDKNITYFGSLSSKSELILPDLEPTFTMLEESDHKTAQQSDGGCTSNELRSAPCFKPVYSGQEKRSRATNQSYHTRRSSCKEIHRTLIKPQQAIPVQPSPSSECFERNIEPNLTEITEACAWSIFHKNGKKSLSQKNHQSKLHTRARPSPDYNSAPMSHGRSTLIVRKPFQCNECDKRFSQNCDLRIHLRTHTGEKPFHCDECGQRFTQNISLKLHLRIHTGEKPFQCDECERRFRLRCDLKKHLMIHTEEKPFQCDECEHRFRLLNDMKKHRRMHAGEKLFQCDKCEKQFSQSSNLTVHKRVHSGEKPFRCTECPQAFPRSHDLKRHRRIHTGEKPFQCDECEHRFSQSNSLKQHQRIHAKKNRRD